MTAMEQALPAEPTPPVDAPAAEAQGIASDEQAAAAPEEKPLVPPSYAYAKRHQVVVGEKHEGVLEVFCGPKVTPLLLAEIRRAYRTPLKIQLLDTGAFDERIRAAYEQGTGQAMQTAGELGDELDLQSVAQSLAEPEDLLETQDDAPIIRLINALLTEAIKAEASDIHIEPYENRLVVRMRVDGVMSEVLTQNKALTPLIVSRIKVMAKLDIAEKRVPQDGRISLRVAGRAVDVRVSTLPSGHGERVVLRLLDKQAGRLDLEQLGMSREAFEVMLRVIERPHGIILVTGPTGSGKTTSLYAALTRLNNRSRNIMTVEDPIEYYIDGIGQTNVNVKVDMTFARGLRAILRQDPDVVMVGEIRDLETAEIAVQASLTGHLVLSTLHTNTAVGAVTRLRDMGVEPFLLSSSLIGVVAQRLVRLLCPQCKRGATATASDCRMLGVNPDHAPTIYHSVGCDHCAHLGYRGRTGIYEVIEIDDTLSGMIHDGASEQKLESYARQKTPGIRADGMRRVLEGDTSLEEVLRVTMER